MVRYSRAPDHVSGHYLDGAVIVTLGVLNLDGTSSFLHLISSLLAGLDNIVFQVVLSERPESVFRAFAICLIQMASLFNDTNWYGRRLYGLNK